MNADQIAGLSFEAMLEISNHHNPQGMGQFIAHMGGLPHKALAVWLAHGLAIDGMGAHGAKPKDIRELWWLAGRHAQRVSRKTGDDSPEWREALHLRRFRRICAWIAKFQTISRWDGQERDDAGLSPLTVFHYMWNNDSDGRWTEDKFECVMRGLWKIRNMCPGRTPQSSIRESWMCRYDGKADLPNPRTLIRLGRMQAETAWVLLRGWEESRRLNYEAYATYRTLTRRQQLASLPKRLATAIVTKGKGTEPPKWLNSVEATTFKPTNRGGLAALMDRTDRSVPAASALKRGLLAWNEGYPLPGSQWEVDHESGFLWAPGVRWAFLPKKGEWEFLYIGEPELFQGAIPAPDGGVTLYPEGVGIVVSGGSIHRLLSDEVVTRMIGKIKTRHGVAFGSFRLPTREVVHFCYAEVDGFHIEGSSTKSQGAAWAAFKKAVRAARKQRPATVKNGEIEGNLGMAMDAGFCLEGTRAFLKENAPYLGHLLAGYTRWEDVPARLLKAPQSLTLSDKVIKSSTYLPRLVAGWEQRHAV